MASNSFGNIFKITTWGESHGPAIGVVIDGVPAGLQLTATEINAALKLRAPGKNNFTSPRQEQDQAEIVAGTFEDTTTGAPISIIIHNHDHDSSKYHPIKDILRPGHANYTYLEKYGIFDYRGGGRASARETACRVAAGVVAQKILDKKNIKVYAYLKSIKDIVASNIDYHNASFENNILHSPIFCPDSAASLKMQQLLRETQEAGDSLGAVVEFCALNLTPGLGDPVYQKLEANLAYAMLSIPASKGFEIGAGFLATKMYGSEHNDLFSEQDILQSNHSGGTLGGISTGMPLIGRVAFKPTASIKKPQKSINTYGEEEDFILPTGSRHDPCVAIRGVWVVKSMLQIVLADAILMQQFNKSEQLC